MTASNGAEAWECLGAMLIQRRTALSPRFHNRGAFCEATGLKYRLVYDIEEARRTNFGTSTLAAIEAAYQLTPGTIRRFLAGAELEPPALASVTPVSRRTSPEMLQALDSFLTGVRALVAEARIRGGPLTGEAIFGDSPVHAQRWDDLVSLGWEQERIIRGVAAMMTWDAEEAAEAERKRSAAGLMPAHRTHRTHRAARRILSRYG